MLLQWNVTFKPALLRDVLALPPKETHQVMAKIDLLTQDPTPDAKVKKSIKCMSRDGHRIYRLRSGNYRLFYTFSLEKQSISLLTMRRRDDDTYDDELDPELLEGLAVDLVDELLPQPVSQPAQPDWEKIFARNAEDRSLPEPVTSELLERLRIPVIYHPRLLRLTTRNELYNCPGVDEAVLLELDEYMFERPLIQVLEQPNLVLNEVDDLLRYREGELLAFLLKLSPEQERYTRWTLNASGPALVKGGPGTGKSTVALYRVYSLLEQLHATGKNTFRILFTTYTNALVKASEQQLRQLLGADAQAVQVSTADKLAYSVLNESAPDEHGTADLDNAPAASLSPSSMGLSFRVGLEVSHIQVTASWGHYQRVEPAYQGTEKGKTQRVWKRTQRQASQSLTLQEGRFERWWHPVAEQPEVFVESIVRHKEDCWLVTLFLVNGQKKPKRLIDRAWLFQPALNVETSNGAPLFRGQVAEPPASLKQEDRPLAMLYRRQINFAVGHGVSTHVITKPGDSTAALRVATTFTPTYDVPLTEAPSLQELPGLTELCLDMRVLAETPAQKLRELLQPLLTTYEAWIEGQTSGIDDPAMELHVFRTEAEEAIQHCRRTLGRIQVGIDLLESNPQAARAFAFLNRAMWQQRIHTMYAEERRNGGQRGLEVLDQPSNRSWRPFQLAFILLNLPPLTIPTHPNRSSSASAIADLLWFPTGGGKTEAYLGLTAYTLAIRRLQGTIAGRSGLDGVAVIMRYTLRLLTLQQFQRAAALMCACEMIRREEGSAQWGETPLLQCSFQHLPIQQSQRARATCRITNSLSITMLLSISKSKRSPSRLSRRAPWIAAWQLS